MVCSSDRSIFSGKRYLPIGLVEAGRGLPLPVRVLRHTGLLRKAPRRGVPRGGDRGGGPPDEQAKLIFFVDDNITSNMEEAKEFFRALIPLKISWVSQASINAAHDEELLRLIKASGCQGLLIGFERLNPQNLKRMNKGFNTDEGRLRGGAREPAPPRHPALRHLHPGYDGDGVDTFEETLQFAMKHRFYMVAFNHLTPFPGTPLYDASKTKAA